MVADAKMKKKGFDFNELQDQINCAMSPVTIKDLSIFSRQFAAMFNAGVAMIRCLQVLTEQCPNPKLRRALIQISAEVQEGTNLSEAMRKHTDCFDVLFISMVAAGEVGGVLDEVLNRTAKMMEDAARLENELKSAMSYPKTVGGIAVVIFLGMTIFLLPTFTGIFEQLKVELPPFTQAMMNISEFLRGPFLPPPKQGYGIVFFVAGLFGAKQLYEMYYKTPMGRVQIDGILLKMPIFGDLIEKTAIARFCNVFGTLTRSGVPILNSLEIVRETAGNQVIANAVDAVRTDIQSGGMISTTMKREGVFPALAIQMIAIGEETGELDKMLMKVGSFYEDEVEQAIKGLTSMLEPLMIVVIGGMVGSILLSMYLPIFKVMDAIK